MSERADKLRRLATGAGWYHPAMLPPLSQVTFREDPSGPNTFRIDPEGNLYFHPSFFDSIDDGARVGSTFHEVMHNIARHALRRGERKLGLWNVAADMTINEFLRACQVKLPEGVFYPPPGCENLSAEALYDRIKDMPEMQSAGAAAEAAIGADGKGSPGVGKGCGCAPGKDGGSPKGTHEDQVRWAKAAAQAIAQGRKAGQGKGDALVRLLAGRPPGIDWGRFVRGVAQQALSAHGRDQQTMTRRNRRSPPGFIFPGWMAVRARIAVAIDTSGSVSDEMLSRAIDQTLALGRLSGIRIFLVTHDHGIQWQGWVSAGASRDRIAQTLRGRGGTCAREAYLAVEKAGATFDAFVHLTDGELQWPARPKNVRKLLAAVYGGEPGSRYWQQPPTGTVVVPVEV